MDNTNYIPGSSLDEHKGSNTIQNKDSNTLNKEEMIQILKVGSNSSNVDRTPSAPPTLSMDISSENIILNKDIPLYNLTRRKSQTVQPNKNQNGIKKNTYPIIEFSDNLGLNNNDNNDNKDNLLNTEEKKINEADNIKITDELKISEISNELRCLKLSNIDDNSFFSSSNISEIDTSSLSRSESDSNSSSDSDSDSDSDADYNSTLANKIVAKPYNVSRQNSACNSSLEDDLNLPDTITSYPDTQSLRLNYPIPVTVSYVVTSLNNSENKKVLDNSKLNLVDEFIHNRPLSQGSLHLPKVSNNITQHLSLDQLNSNDQLNLDNGLIKSKSHECKLNTDSVYPKPVDSIDFNSDFSSYVNINNRNNNNEKPDNKSVSSIPFSTLDCKKSHILDEDDLDSSLITTRALNAITVNTNSTRNSVLPLISMDTDNIRIIKDNNPLTRTYTLPVNKNHSSKIDDDIKSLLDPTNNDIKKSNSDTIELKDKSNLPHRIPETISYPSKFTSKGRFQVSCVDSPFIAATTTISKDTSKVNNGNVIEQATFPISLNSSPGINTIKNIDSIPTSRFSTKLLESPTSVYNLNSEIVDNTDNSPLRRKSSPSLLKNIELNDSPHRSQTYPTKISSPVIIDKIKSIPHSDVSNNVLMNHKPSTLTTPIGAGLPSVYFNSINNQSTSHTRRCFTYETGGSSTTVAFRKSSTTNPTLPASKLQNEAGINNLSINPVLSSRKENHSIERDSTINCNQNGPRCSDNFRVPSSSPNSSRHNREMSSSSQTVRSTSSIRTVESATESHVSNHSDETFLSKGSQSSIQDSGMYDPEFKDQLSSLFLENSFNPQTSIPVVNSAKDVVTGLQRKFAIYRTTTSGDHHSRSNTILSNCTDESGEIISTAPSSARILNGSTSIDSIGSSAKTSMSDLFSLSESGIIGSGRPSIVNNMMAQAVEGSSNDLNSLVFNKHRNKTQPLPTSSLSKLMVSKQIYDGDLTEKLQTLVDTKNNEVLTSIKPTINDNDNSNTVTESIDAKSTSTSKRTYPVGRFTVEVEERIQKSG